MIISVCSIISDRVEGMGGCFLVWLQERAKIASVMSVIVIVFILNLFFC